ncbi:MAG: hypothetical protein QOJ35_2250 [Solirubrobacteraceae bacterium]|jgi:hypothetical protein|nr:hypothetical protein [Solirubrobacteraceae bacterium]
MTGAPYDGERVDGVAVLDDLPPLEQQRGSVALSPAVVQTAAVVGVGMVAGATAVALVKRRRVRRLARRRRRILAPVLASRSFLIDVHVLGERK